MRHFPFSDPLDLAVWLSLHMPRDWSHDVEGFTVWRREPARWVLPPLPQLDNWQLP